MSSSPGTRRGAVTVEFALVIPLLISLVFTGIEFARVNMIRNSIENAVYEGARRGVVPGATAAECADVVQEQLDLLGLTGATIQITPDPIQSSTTSVSAGVSVPITVQNGYVTPRFYLGRTLDTEITLKRERPF